MGAHPRGVLILVGGVHHHQIGPLPELVNDEVVHTAPLVVAHGGIAHLAVIHARKIVGQHMIEVSQGVRPGEYQLSHVADVEKPRGGTHCHMLGDDPGGVLYRQEVSRVIAVKLANSLWLMALAWVISGVVGFALGVLAGMKKGTWLDKGIKGYSLLIASTPTFWLALLLLMIFAVWLKILPIGLSVPIGAEASGVTVLDRIRHAILPALTLSITGISNITLHTREKMIDIMESDYVLFARARGESMWSIFQNHGLRNVILPAITLQFASVSEIFGGSVLVEQIFSYPGLGQAAVTAGIGSDVPLLLGITVISAAFVFGGNLIANLLYGVVDPRIRRGGART